MVYDWENKEEICYRMYIEEKKSLEDIMEFMKVHHKFNPSKRAFQTQFKRWEFPSKQNPAHKNADLVRHVKELWEKNTSQREMLRILNEEYGFEIKERELMRVRAKNRWLLRVPNGMKTPNKARPVEQEDVLSQLDSVLYGSEGQAETTSTDASDNIGQARATSPELSPEVIKKRQERIAHLQAESAERWVSRKRRRRTRGWAGLPADPPGPPRFPSETTIDESKAFLSLDSQMYRDIRAKFQRICEESDVIKKTIAGPERWEAVKARLVQESPHLQQVMWHDQENTEGKKLALDVVCTDVTKRMRTLERRMTIAEAKNVLGVNPEESRQIRNGFYKILKEDHFTSKVEAGNDHWKELKAQWIEESELLKGILADGDADPMHAEKIKALEVLCRDVMKRLRDDQTKRDPSRRKKFDSIVSASVAAQPPTNESTTNGSQHIPSRGTVDSVQPDLGAYADGYPGQELQQEMSGQQSSYGTSTQNMNYQLGPHDALVQAAAHAQAQAQAQARAQSQIANMAEDMQIDPSLLLAAANDPSLLGHSQYSPQFGHASQYGGPVSQPSYQPAHTSIAVYFRLHASSDIQASQRLWVGTLTQISLEELRQLAASKFPMTVAGLIEGIVKGENGGEVALRIEEDEELEAYLGGAGGMKPVFAVQIMQVWKERSTLSR